MVRSGSVFCAGQKTRTNKQQSLSVRTSCPGFVVFVTYAAPCTLSNYAGNADSRIFSRTGNRVYGRRGEEEMKINFLSVTRTIYLTLSSSDSGVHLSRLPQQQDLCCRGAARFLQRHRCEPLSLLMSWLFWRF